MRFACRVSYLAAVVATAAVAAAGAGDGSDFGSVVESYARNRHFNGAALVARVGAVVYQGGYGMASFEAAAANTPATVFRLASISKTLTSVTVMTLVDEGKLTLDTTLADALPSYRADTGSRITIRHLLTHTSGIPDYLRQAAFREEALRMQVDKAEFVKKYCSGDLESEPGTRWSYCNSGYFLLGVIVERLTGVPFERALRERVLQPAGMSSTGDEAAAPDAIVPGFANGYEWRGDSFHRMRLWNMATAFAAGSVYSTVGDLYRFDRALAGSELVSEAAKQAMFTAGVGGYGCGWEIRSLPIGPAGATRTIATHEGFLYGHHTRIYRVLEDGHLVVLLSNGGDAPIEAMASSLLDLLYGRPARPALPSAAPELFRVAGEQGAAAVAARFREIKAKEADRWDVSERELNVLGYELLRAGRANDAVAVFRLNVEEHADSGNAWDSLGEGLAAAGERDEAIRSYARSLQLTPGNRNAVRQLASLMQ
jgi:CubicO group peptidase (beta-lactamase class C family)